MLQLGSPGEDQLDLLPGKVTGIPPSFHYHPFWYIDWKGQIRGMDDGYRPPVYVDFGFMCASSSDYSKPSKAKDRVINSWDGYALFLLVVDKASQYTWVFLMKSKEPPFGIIDTFIKCFGYLNSGSVHSDQGGKLARSVAFSDMLLRKHTYVVEPTSANSQNRAVKKYNAKLAVQT